MRRLHPCTTTQRCKPKCKCKATPSKPLPLRPTPPGPAPSPLSSTITADWLPRPPRKTFALIMFALHYAAQHTENMPHGPPSPLALTLFLCLWRGLPLAAYELSAPPACWQMLCAKCGHGFSLQTHTHAHTLRLSVESRA